VSAPRRPQRDRGSAGDTVKYRKVDAQVVGATQLKSEALQAEQLAYARECDLDVLKELKVTDDAVKNQAKSLRRAAGRISASAGLTSAESTQVQMAFLDGWIGVIEEKHAEMAAQATSRESWLKGGPTRLNASEREAIQSELAALQSTLEELEAAHRVATRRFDALSSKGGKKLKIDLP